MLRHVAIIYGSAYGQTAKIAFRIRNVLLEDGLLVAFLNAEAIQPAYDLSGFDGIIIGSSVIGGRHRKTVQRFVDTHRAMLNKTPSAFFSVSGAAGSLDLDKQAEARSLMDRFLAAAGWNSRLKATFGGALAYTRYSFLLRWLMKRIARKEGAPTDTTRDYEFTNWEHVEDFAHQFARLVSPVRYPARIRLVRRADLAAFAAMTNPSSPHLQPAKRRTERALEKV